MHRTLAVSLVTLTTMVATVFASPQSSPGGDPAERHTPQDDPIVGRSDHAAATMPGNGPWPGSPGDVARARGVVDCFDDNDDGWLNSEERRSARAHLKAEAAERPRPGPGGRRGRGPDSDLNQGGGGPPPSPGRHVEPDEVAQHPDEPMFATSVLRTLFLEFEAADWEEELEDFHNTDVDVPCTLTVDGRFYPNVGVSFRGASSYMMVPRGAKRSLNLSMDLANPDQHLHGHRTLNLLNGHGDPSLMSTVLYSHIAMRRIPTPRANFVRVVINGESWGVYTCVEQFNKDFVKDRFGTDSGARWKVKGSPNGRSGLDYTGDDLAVYRARYQIKSKDREEDWHALVNLCRTLSEAPLDELEEALRPILNIDGALWFLALDIVLVNSDGYWTRASDYNLYRDPKGVFHIVPHDMNEAFSNTVGGPRRGTGGPGEMARPPATQPRRSGTTLDPRVGMNDAGKPLRSRLLAVPSLRTRYLEMVHAIASEDLSWDALGTVVDEYRNLIDAEVQADTRKLASYDAFVHATSPDLADGVVQPEGAGDRGRRRLSLRQFVDQRRQFLLEYLNEKPSPAETGEASH